MDEKVALALVGAVIGWALKALWDLYTVRLRWERLSPLILRQVRSAAQALTTSFDAQHLPRISAKLIAAQAAGTEIVASGIKDSNWLVGLERIADCLDAIQSVDSSGQAFKGKAISDLRACGEALDAWVRTTWTSPS